MAPNVDFVYEKLRKSGNKIEKCFYKEPRSSKSLKYSNFTFPNNGARCGVDFYFNFSFVIFYNFGFF